MQLPVLQIIFRFWTMLHSASESCVVVLRGSFNFCCADGKGALKSLWNGSGPSLTQITDVSRSTFPCTLSCQ